MDPFACVKMDHEEGDVQLYIESWNRINRWILEGKMNWILDQESELDSGVGDERDTRAVSWMNCVVEQEGRMSWILVWKMSCTRR